MQTQILGGLFGQDDTAAVKADGLVSLAGAEGNIPGQVAVLCRRHDAHAGALAFGIVDGGGFGIHRAPVLHGAVAVQLLCQPLLHGQGFGVAEGDGHIVVGQLRRLLCDDGQQGILYAEADKQQRGAARHAQHGHEEPLFIPEQVAGGGLLGEGHPGHSGVMRSIRMRLPATGAGAAAKLRSFRPDWNGRRTMWQSR